MLVAYQFKSDAARITKAFSGVADLSTPKGMASYRKGSARIGLAHPASLGHGIDGLQHNGNVLVRFGHNWDLGQRMQMLERIGPMRQIQAGFDRNVFVYDLIAEGTIEIDLLAAHARKLTVQTALLQAMKR